VKVNFWLANALLIVWLKLKEVFAPAATDTGVRPVVELTPPAAVLTQVTPHVTSKVSDGLVMDAPTIRTTSFTLVDNGLVTTAVQL